MSTETLGNVSEAELGQFEPKGSNLREGNTREEHQQQISPPLGVELTGYRLLTTSVIPGLGIPKALYSYSGQSLISTTLDWVAGIVLALILFWLSVIEAQRPELFPRFFQVDLAPPILKFLGRPEVQLWFLSVLPLLSGTNQVRAMLDARRDDEAANGIPAHLIKDGLTLAVLALSVAVCIFCLQCLRVVWPRGFSGTAHHILLFSISATVWLAYDVYMVVKVFSRSEEYPRSVIKIAAHNVLCMFPFTLLPLGPLSRQLDSHRQGHLLPLRQNDLFWAVYVVFAEAVLMGTFGLPDFPEGAYVILFSCCVAIFFSSQLLDMVPILASDSLVPSLARALGASKIAYDGVRRAGSEARVYGSSAFDRVRKVGSKGRDWMSDIYDRVSGAGNKA